jgi:hypothetical protein
MEKRKKPKKHLTNLVALQIVYDSEVCTDNYANPRSAFLLLRYIPSAKSFLACRQVKDLAATRANPENQAAPAHDIRHMSRINLKKLLPPPRVQAEASKFTPPGDLIRKRKRKGASKGETSCPEPQIIPEVLRTETSQIEVDDLPPTIQPGIELDPSVPSKYFEPSKEPAPLWVPSYEAYGESVRSDATVLKTGGVGSNTVSALSEVARLPADMVVWKQSTDREVIDNLRRGLMMVSLLICYLLPPSFLSF